MKAVVTGAAGFVGKHLVEHLTKSGDDVIGLDKRRGPDLCSAEEWKTLESLSGVDVLYHLAGWSSVGRSWDEPASVFDVNVTGTANVLEAARNFQVGTVVLVSSAEVYEASSNEPLEETTSLAPSSPYAASKIAAELLGEFYADKYNQRVVIARPFNQIGPGQVSDFVIPSFAQQIVDIESGQATGLRHGNLDAIRDFTDVRDAVEAYRLLAQHGVSGEAYNICSQKNFSIADLLEKLTSLSTTEIRTELDPERNRPSDCPIKLGSLEKTTQATGWTPTTDLVDTLADVLTEARNNQL